MNKFKKYFDEMSDEKISFLYESIYLRQFGYENRSFEEEYDRIIFEADFSSNKFWKEIKKISDIPCIGRTATDMLSMLNDSCKKKYAITHKTRITITFALLYWKLPIDIIPDRIPIFGELDDVKVLKMAFESVVDDMNRYKVWKRNEELKEFIEDLDSVYNERCADKYSEYYEEDEEVVAK